MSSAALHSALPLARRDLVATPTLLRGRRYWTLKDPVALRYYQLRDEEHFLWGLLDGQRSIDQLVAEFEGRFAPRRLRPSEVSGFLMLLHREGLVLAPAWGQGAQLVARRQQRLWQQRLAQLSNVLAIQLPGLNPNRFLSAIVPRLGWLFSAWSLAAVLLLWLTAGVLVMTNLGTLAQRLPHLHDFFAPHNLLWLAAALALVKTLHELGHAVVCKYFGGECNRLGLMLLVFTPALYCDVSDAWIFTSRWQRIAVSAAGMAVELVLAALAVILWSVTEPGWFNTLCLNIVVVCSVGTLLINGNPLLRYDGYYILADLLGAPNLRQQAAAAVNRGLARLFAGVELQQPRLLAEPPWPVLWAYGIGAVVYRAVLLVAILWLVHTVLAPRGLAVVAQIVTVLTLAAVVAPSVNATARWVGDPARRRQLRPWRLLGTTLGLVMLAGAILLVPIPSRVTAPIVLRPQDARRVYVTTPGRLENIAAAGAQVAAGQEIGRLHSSLLERQIAALTSRRDAQKLHLAQLQLQRHTDESLADQIPAAARLLADLEAQLSLQQTEQARLTLTAPIAGKVLPPPARNQQTEAGELDAFDGTPLDEPNRGCLLEAGTLVCLIGDPALLEGVAVVGQEEVQRVSPGQRVRLALDALPGQLLKGRVTEVSRLNSGELPPEILSRQMLPSEQRPDGRVGGAGTYYETVIEIDPPASPLPLNAAGWARINVPAQPLWLHLYRSLRRTFRLAL